MDRPRNALGTKCVLTILCQNALMKTPIAYENSTYTRYLTTFSPVRTPPDTNISSHQRSQQEGLGGFIPCLPLRILGFSYPLSSLLCYSITIIPHELRARCEVCWTFSLDNERHTCHGAWLPLHDCKWVGTGVLTRTGNSTVFMQGMSLL